MRTGAGETWPVLPSGASPLDDPMTTSPPPVAEGEHGGLREALASDPLGLAGHRNWDGEGPGANASPAGPSDRWALIRLVAVVAAALILAYAAGVGETVLLVLALIVCIVLHELGHFLTAKAAGIKVTEFFVGFGPTLWSVRRGETEYGVKGIPLGGYCRIIGMHNLEEVDPADEARTYREKPLWRRLSVALAGSAMHFLIALAVLFAMFFWTGDSNNYLAVPAANPIIGVYGLAQGRLSPAEQAGIKVGDRIISVDGRHFATFTQLGAYIQARPDERLTVVVQRRGQLLTLHPTTVNEARFAAVGTGEAQPKKPTGYLGVAVSDVVHSGFLTSVSDTGGAWVHSSALTLDALGRLATLHGIDSYFHMLSSQKAADSTNPDGVRFESPVGVVRLFHSAAADGAGTVLYLLAVVNLSLGIFNLIPLLPLDGGHVAIALYEGSRSRRGRRYHADVNKLLPLFYLAIALIVFLGATSLFLDIRDLVT
jgi:membrane-associated protease RseP (regulator of RpoE activity)